MHPPLTASGPCLLALVQLSILAIEVAARRKLPEGAKEGANALAGLLFLFAFSRVLLSDVSAAGGKPMVEGIGNSHVAGGLKPAERPRGGDRVGGSPHALLQ